MSLQQDIGPWLSDYAEEIAKPAVDFTLTRIDEPTSGGYDPSGHKPYCTPDRCHCGPQ